MTKQAKFALGEVVATPGAERILADNRVSGGDFLSRHNNGDWGDLCLADILVNEDGLRAGGRLMSTYTLAGGQKLWIITEWDRSVTTLLLPEEY